MSNARRISLLVGAAIIAAACSPAASSAPPSAGPPASPGSSPGPSGGTSGSIDYDTGPTDLILQYEEGGGMMLEWNLVQAPIFSLYGDGVVVFRDPTTQAPADETGLLEYDPFRTARLSPEQMDQLLAFAVTEGGLAAARDRYDHPTVADGGTTFFRLNAGGRSKEVSIYSLYPDEGAPDQVARRQFLALAERLRTFDQGGSIPTAEYAPQAWRAHLLESGGQPLKIYGWPWPDLEPKDFAVQADDPNAPSFPSRVMTADEVAALGLGELKGGLIGYNVKGADGKIYNLIIRPLLPHEER